MQCPRTACLWRNCVQKSGMILCIRPIESFNLVQDRMWRRKPRPQPPRSCAVLETAHTDQGLWQATRRSELSRARHRQGEARSAIERRQKGLYLSISLSLSLVLSLSCSLSLSLSLCFFFFSLFLSSSVLPLLCPSLLVVSCLTRPSVGLFVCRLAQV